MSAICVRLCATWLCRGRGARPGFSLGAPCGCAPPRAGLGRARVASRASPRPAAPAPPGGRARKTGTPTARGPDSVLPLFYSTATLPRSENYHLRLKRAVAYRFWHACGRSPFRCTRRFRGKTLTPTNKAAAPYMQAPCAHSWDRIVRCEPSSWPISHGPWMLGDVRKGLAHLRRLIGRPSRSDWIWTST